MKRLDRSGRVTAVPCQNRAARERVGIREEQCAQAAWAVDVHGRLHRGAGAFNAALAHALGAQVILSFYHLPVVRWIQDRVYDLVAWLRPHLPGVEPYCLRHPEECD